MPKLPGNRPMLGNDGQTLTSLAAINRLDRPHKEAIYARLLPQRLLDLLQLDTATLRSHSNDQLVQVIAPEGLSFVRIEARARPEDADVIFFAELADTQFHQMELAFCIICDPAAPRFAVDVTEAGAVNYFSSQGRNLQEELRAMQADPRYRDAMRRDPDYVREVDAFAERYGKLIRRGA